MVNCLSKAGFHFIFRGNFGESADEKVEHPFACGWRTGEVFRSVARWRLSPQYRLYKAKTDAPPVAQASHFIHKLSGMIATSL